ncbi:TPA: hypothetical protein ACH3X3_003863 [Trebouxia sp. C0006]
MVDLHITDWLLIGMGKKLIPVELCSYTLANKHSNELMWSVVHNNNSKARVSFFAKLRFVSWHDTESLFTAEIQQCLRGINADAEALRAAQCKLNPARNGRAEDVRSRA